MSGRLKRAVFFAANRLGIDAVVAKTNWRNRRLVVIGYHGISLADEHEWNPGLFMPPEMLHERLAALRRLGYQVLPLETALELLRDGRLPERSAVLTFDDGYFNFRAAAIPILTEFSYPATVYLTTYYCLNQMPVFNPLCSYLLWKGRNRELAFPGRPAWRLEAGAAPGRREEVCAQIVRHTRETGMPAEEKNELARAIATYLHLDFDEISARRIMHLMTPQEVRASVAHPSSVSVELHTHRHRMPARQDEFASEVERNRSAICEILGNSCHPRHFCYPSGEYNRAQIEWLRAMGIVSATTCNPGLAATATDPLELPRFIDSTSFPLDWFSSVMSGFAELLPHRRLAPQ